MGKYAYAKLSIILYHKSTDLSIGIAKFLKNVFQGNVSACKKFKSKAAITAC